MTQAQIFSRGYREYTGPRTGVRGAIRSVAWHSSRSVLGIGRPGRFKVIPILIVLLAYVPSIVFVGLSILIGGELFDAVAPAYSDIIANVIFPVLLFASFVIPGVLVRDRRDGMLSMYLSTPMQRSSYIVAKSVAVFTVMLAVTLGPSLLQLLGYTFAGVGPDGFDGWIATIVRMLVSGVFVAVVLGTIGMAASSTTDRPMFASVGIVLMFLISAAASATLIESGASPYIGAIGLIESIADAVQWIFGDPTSEMRPPGWYSFAACVAWTTLAAGITWSRYRKMVAIR